jgi:spermidine dehydrogenase
VNGTLVGVGATLLTSAAPAFALAGKVRPVEYNPWDGYGGVGDYAISNGNVASTLQAAHFIRDGLTDEMMQAVSDTGEVYDLVIIGGGFSGIGAAYEFHEKYGDTRKCLILENHPVFGGEAKQNEFEVDGYRLFGPQASNDFGPPDKNGTDLIADIYRNTGLPFDFSYRDADPMQTGVKAPQENFYGMLWEESRYDTGYFVGEDADEPWVINPSRDDFAHMPWEEEFKAELSRALADKADHYKGGDVDRWLDSMTYKDLLEKELGYSSEVTKYLDPVLAISMGGVGADVYSAYSAKLLEMPGTVPPYDYDPDVEEAHSFPGGNSAIFRHIMKYMNPDCIEGGTGLEEVLYNAINFDALDRPQNPMNFRLNSTVIDVRHDGDPDRAGQVLVSYTREGKVQRVRAKTVVMAVGGWVARRIVKDMPASVAEAYGQFYHSPVLVVNVAVRNWHFLDKLGISSARWFDGWGSFMSLRRPMITGDTTQPFDPDKPAVLNFYTPFNNPGHSETEQGAIGRADLLAKSYADYEQEITSQLTRMFAAYGFDAERDIAGIILNRWGHAYISPQPGFHFGRDGKTSPIETVKKGYGRIQFGHSELTGYMSHTRALNQGSTAARKVMSFL